MLIAAAPTYASAGAIAPAVLVLARMLQGLSVGGEYGASATYLSEMAMRNRRAFWASFQYITLIGGQLLALAVVVLLQFTMSEAHLQEWGWRVAFGVGALLAFAVYVLRTRLAETKSFTDQSDDRPEVVDAQPVAAAPARIPDRRGDQRRRLGRLLCLHHLHAEVPGQHERLLAFDGDRNHDRRAGRLHADPALVGARRGSLGPQAVALSVRFRRNAGVVPGVHRDQPRGDAAHRLGLILVPLVLLGAYTAISGLIKAELFPPHIRTLGVALPYAIGNTVFGGTAEYVALWFKQAGARKRLLLVPDRDPRDGDRRLPDAARNQANEPDYRRLVSASRSPRAPA